MTDAANGFGLIHDIDVRLTVELGRAQMRLREVLELAEDSVVMLDRLIDEPLDVMVNGKLIARGEVIAEGNRFALRIIELASNASSDNARDRRAAPIRVSPMQEKAGFSGRVTNLPDRPAAATVHRRWRDFRPPAAGRTRQFSGPWRQRAPPISSINRV